MPSSIESPPTLDDTQDNPRIRRTELLISLVLRIGVFTSLALVTLGTILALLHPSIASENWRQLTSDAGQFPGSFSWLIDSLLVMNGPALIVLGLLLLILTPVGRVVISIFAFWRQHDRFFVIITTIVLGLLLLSFILGKAG